MKTVQTIGTVLSALMIFSVSASADRGGHERGGYYPSRHVQMVQPRHNHTNWVVPLVVGGVLGYALSEPRRESVTYVRSVSSPVIYRSSAYQSQPVYQEQWVYFNDCDCQRRVLVPVR